MDIQDGAFCSVHRYEVSDWRNKDGVIEYVYLTRTDMSVQRGVTLA